MFEQEDVILKVVEGAYKKLKSYYYYDKTLLYIKKKIAMFEKDEKKFQSAINDIAKNICNQNMEYFNSLISYMDFRVLPKKLVSQDNDSDALKSDVDHNKDIERLNFFIDLPVELLIIDMIWTLFVGKIGIDNHAFSKYSYAGRFKYSIFEENEKDLIKSIDFSSNRCFEPYFQLYSEWRNKALDTVKNKKPENELVLMSLDLKSFYYSVEFSFENLSLYLNGDTRLKEIEFMTKIIEKIYLTYTEKISKYKKGIKKSPTISVFPIGLLSPIVLRELYLKQFDNNIVNELKPFYYGRYVDDILIVCKANGMKKYTIQNYLDDFFISKKMLTTSIGRDLRFTDYINIRVQKEKINCIFFEKGKKDILLDVYNDLIRINSSEANLLPDMDLLNETFNNSAYFFNGSNKGSKLRDLTFMQSDNYNATIFVNGLKRILKNTQFDLQKINPYLDEIMEFYSDSQGIEFSNSWRSVFELLILSRDKKAYKKKSRANQFYYNISQYIKKLSFSSLDDEELYQSKKNTILSRLKRNLKDHLDISISLAVALDYDSASSSSHKGLGKIFRNTNMLNHKMISYPLTNYSKYLSENTISLIEFDMEKVFLLNKDILKLDEMKLKWTPRFIHLDELHFYDFISDYNIEKYNRQSSDIYRLYLNINNLSPTISNPMIEIENDAGYEVRLQYLYINNKICNYVRIGLVNTNISEKDALNCLIYKNKQTTLQNKQRLYRILNIAREQKTNFLTFPEFYMPITWLYDITNFAKMNGITIITGLQYMTCEQQALNYTSIIVQTISKKGFKNAVPLFREKNYYAPEEKVELSKRGFYCIDKNRPQYFIIKYPGIDFSTILCFEFTDIYSRASLKSKIDILFVPQLNKDTRYFSSIVESTARDLHCFIVQANTSKYGDSRITAPFKTDYKDILRIKGGINDVVIVGEVDLNKFRAFQKSFPRYLEKAIRECYQCYKKFNGYKKPAYERCEKCEKKLMKEITKGLPPNFKRLM